MSTMVDSKIGKSFQRSVGRAKEKILQNLGKVDRTADEILDDHINNFSKQQYAATRLQKELNNYIRCIRACSTSSRALLEAVNEVYEPEWGGKELLTVNSQSVELLWNDFAHRLAEQVLIPLNTYQGQFPETRKKIEKRGRKLVDFDGERHALQAMQSNPRRAETKLARQRENLEAAKRTYDVLNSELHEELPALFNSRIVFLVSAMSTLFASEHIFHSESSKVFTELESIVEKLAREAGKGTMNFAVSSNAVLNNTSDSPKDATNGNVSPVSKTSSNPSTPVTPTSPVSKLSMEENNGSVTQNGVSKSNGSIKPDTNTEIKRENGNHTTEQNNTINNLESNTTSDNVAELLVASGSVGSSNNNDEKNNSSSIDQINNVTQQPSKPTSPSPLLNAAQPPVNGVDSFAAVNQKNADLANPNVITPSAPPALPDSSNTTTPPANEIEIEASNDNAKVSTTPAVNGTNELNNDGANKATTPSSPEREEPGTNASDSLDTTTDTDMKTRAIETQQPEQDSLTSRELDDDATEKSDKDNKDVTTNDNENAKNQSKSSPEDKAQEEQEINNNDESERNKNLKIGHDENNNNVKNNSKDVDAAAGSGGGEPTKPLHGILSTSKNRMGNGRMESPENDHQVPANTSDEEPGVLYRVRATYRYQKEDVDELSFEAGEIVRVIEYDDPEEQEEGWLMGIKDNGEKGMFPANFTKPI